MSLYIRDNEVDELATRLLVLTGAKTKTAAVKFALKTAVEQAQETQTIDQKLQPAIDLIKSLGEPDPDFDMKKFSDELWDE